ncbi:MAG: CDP-diacylglycerol--serine O-phosphatidyltransferase [Gemmatimonadota bacterium]|nr:MAG: CDP-diacylglycerol--serine O-phosphatidyltransferase [Gemmatimonadota bacterium]
MKKTGWALPYFFTVSNLFCGFLAVAYSLNEQYVAASWLIIAAGFLDGLDGKIARFTGSSTRFGVEFDSMADLISFGVAPAVLLYKYQFYRLEFLGWILMFFYIAAGAFRLARFNLHFKGVREGYFRGIPITMAGMTIAALIIFTSNGITIVGTIGTTTVLTLLLSILMISTIRYEGLPGFALTTRKEKAKVLILTLSAVVIVINPTFTFFPLMVCYILCGIFEWSFSIVKRTVKPYIHSTRNRNL